MKLLPLLENDDPNLNNLLRILKKQYVGYKTLIGTIVDIKLEKINTTIKNGVIIEKKEIVLQINFGVMKGKYPTAADVCQEIEEYYSIPCYFKLTQTTLIFR